ncbi:pre-RNA processing PIH1/Nop17-domain-containing protein [Gymnopilus junonius]|uniref:Pre-RNA processing PIH1/Nop17-domain-containing protein n=1 Tax=Gymnopilus junonius TaxID=109634 RepID=A0A9P5NN93_GYMJU|nr:pre-RNA processing PIH1/Nop17-domain-containing protein [Gymnopilus junonius]
MSTHVRIELSPKPGFCIKSNALAPALLPPPPSAPKNPNLLEPTGPITVSKSQKVFVNIAWDSNVPPPPDGSEDAIQRAMQGEEIDEGNPAGWYVPVIVSNARQDKDKAGNPSLVFDCIFNSSLKSRTLRDPEFKIFLIELSLQRIEAQTGLTLSRSIGTPNILSKGKLLPRTVQVPASMVPALTGAPSPSSSNTANQSKPLIQELSSTSDADGSGSMSKSSIEPQPQAPSNAPTTRTADSALPGLRGILKKPSATGLIPASATLTPAKIAELESTPLEWSWKKEDSGRLRIDVLVPGLSLELIQSSTLDIEPRRMVLAISKRPTLDINLALSDAEIAARVGALYASFSPSSTAKPKSLEEEKDKRKQEETTRLLQLKRQRDFDVDGAEAEWKVGSDTVTVYL